MCVQWALYRLEIAFYNILLSLLGDQVCVDTLCIVSSIPQMNSTSSAINKGDYYNTLNVSVVFIFD